MADSPFSIFTIILLVADFAGSLSLTDKNRDITALYLPVAFLPSYLYQLHISCSRLNNASSMRSACITKSVPAR